MYIADMHSDSLGCVSAGRGLVTDYNTSRKYPQLTFFAALTKFGGMSLLDRRATVNRMLNVYLYETDRLGISRICDAKDLMHAMDTECNSSIFAIEGGGGLFADCEELITLHKAGLRVLGPIWDTNELGGSSQDSRIGLTDEGRRLIASLCELGITVDVSHMSDAALYETLEICPLPVIASHSNLRDICNSKRNLPTDMAKEIAARGGVIGLSLYPNHLNESGTATPDDILRHISYSIEQLGENAIALGCDIDGTGGRYPEGYGEHLSIHDKLAELLSSHFGEQTVNRIMGENVTDFLKCNL